MEIDLMAKRALIIAVETQLQLLEDFFTLLNRETGELANIQLDAMAEINILKESAAVRIEAHSAVLRKKMEEAAIHEGLSAKATLGELAQAYKQRGEEDLSRLHKELNRAAERVRQSLDTNREIAERFASSVTTSLELLTRVLNQSNTYGASGGYQQKPTGAVLINREA